MPVKMTGAQFKAFLATEWGPDAYWEDTEILKNGEEVDEGRDSDPTYYADTDTVTILGGTIIPDQSQPPSLIEYVDAVKFARKWLKAQSTVTLVVEVPREHAEWFASGIKGMGVNKEFAKIVERIG
ncbi:hypothetical protein LOK46_10385 [Methylobacterium sp. NMS14P]|uniref:hypothetical protein n=1 Tax=Methylobacterium sp. NMS14P TaxID=2894310 RepID=UPI002359473C|nr:hypothetical protein [Methylobacterium sp. NMS14P]WCS27196.1 hypothetical protein LOK46_10385 [Methylobacterium sp. NMS14P]